MDFSTMTFKCLRKCLYVKFFIRDVTSVCSSLDKKLTVWNIRGRSFPVRPLIRQNQLAPWSLLPDHYRFYCKSYIVRIGLCSWKHRVALPHKTKNKFTSVTGQHAPSKTIRNVYYNMFFWFNKKKKLFLLRLISFAGPGDYSESCWPNNQTSRSPPPPKKYFVFNFIPFVCRFQYSACEQIGDLVFRTVKVQYLSHRFKVSFRSSEAFAYMG